MQKTMKGRYPIVVFAVLALIYGLACSFSAALNTTSSTPTAAPEPTATRPQSVFINAVSAPVATPEVNDPPPAAQSYSSPNIYYPPGSMYYAQPYTCAPNYNWAYSYIVQMGDTLSNIAARAGTSWQVIAQANCIPDPNRIFVGQVLRVPYAIAYLPHPYNPPPYHYRPGRSFRVRPMHLRHG